MLYVIGNNGKEYKYSVMIRSFIIRTAAWIIVLCTVLLNLYAGDTAKVVLQELKRNALRSYNRGDVYQAIAYYDSCVRMDEDDLKSLNRLAMLYFSTRNYKEAARCFERLTDAASDDYKLAWYYYGIVSMNLEEYTGARERFTAFRKVWRKKHDPDQYRRMAAAYIESADWAIAHTQSSAAVTIHHLNADINGSHIQFSPSPVDQNTLLYGSLVTDDRHPGSGVRQVYVAEKKNEKWIHQELLAGPVNDPGIHTGNAVISDDGQRMYFTRSRKNWQNKEISEIYVSYKSEGNWQQPQKLLYPVNSENSTSTQPALGMNLRTGKDILYFVSDRRGTKGGLDIWYTEPEKDKTSWKEPKNLGRNINSLGNECCPFYDLYTRTLYFSSSGNNGYGGYDGFKATGSATRWTDAVNLGKPLNTSFDDLFFSILKNGREGFFTSNRPGSLSMDNGSCCDDIFYYHIDECTRIVSQGIVINSSNRDIYDELNTKYNLDLEYPEDSARLAEVPVKLYAVEKETGDEIFIMQTRTDDNGRYTFELETGKNYLILIRNYGFFDKRIRVSTEQMNCSDTMIIRPTGITYLPGITVRFNVYYEHDKYRLTPEARTAIDTTLLSLIDLFPNAVVEIGSHTDSTGTDEYNIRLSQRRSESVVKYLASKGIQESRLQAKGYGESVPVAPNSHPDGSDNPDGRQLNRRTELKIIGESNLFYEDE
ncbi:MAG: OmpA family protein [Bacteroidales bacterium]|nr:OmpA family protein [Bacteroidales bacterium]